MAIKSVAAPIGITSQNLNRQAIGGQVVISRELNTSGQAGIRQGMDNSGHVPVSKSRKTGSGKDPKLERIINKFKAGKKLTQGELAYLAKKSPEIYQKVLRIMQQREQLEERLENAESKEEVQQIMMEEMQSIENISDEFEKEATMNHLREAYTAAVKSDSYRLKPETAASEMDILLAADLQSASDLQSAADSQSASDPQSASEKSGSIQRSGQTSFDTETIDNEYGTYTRDSVKKKGAEKTSGKGGSLPKTGRLVDVSR